MTTEKTNPQAQVAKIPKNIADVVAEQISNLQKVRRINLPADYSVNNALMSAWLKIVQTEDRSHKPALAVCTKDSIAQALLDMVLQGLNPAKLQCYFIVYGDRLTMQRSYFGTVALVMGLTGCNVPRVEVVYQDDEFKYELTATGKKIVKHEQKLENIDLAKIKAAYCEITWPTADNRAPVVEIMTWQQIRNSWKHSKTYEPGKAEDWHNLEAEEAVKRTILARASKLLINSTSDKMLLEAIQRSEDEADEAAAGETIAEGMGAGVSIEASFTEVKDEIKGTTGEAAGMKTEEVKTPEPAKPVKPKAPFA